MVKGNENSSWLSKKHGRGKGCFIIRDKIVTAYFTNGLHENFFDALLITPLKEMKKVQALVS